MDPLLIDVPERIETERLVLRAPRAGDGADASTRPIRASHAELAPWLPWAGTLPTRRRIGGALPAPAGALHPARGLRAC